MIILKIKIKDLIELQQKQIHQEEQQSQPYLAVSAPYLCKTNNNRVNLIPPIHNRNNCYNGLYIPGEENTANVFIPIDFF